MNISLQKKFLVTNIYLYINPKRGFRKNPNFEHACHFCSKEAVQKQWSLTKHKEGTKRQIQSKTSKIPSKFQFSKLCMDTNATETLLNEHCNVTAAERS